MNLQISGVKMDMNGFLSVLFCFLAVLSVSRAADDASRTWTDPTLAGAEDPDFLVQGEYGSAEPGAWGLQTVALGAGSFEAYLLEGGLPGAGWTREKSRTKLSGKRTEDGAIRLVSGDGTHEAALGGGKAVVTRGGAPLAELPRIERVSPTMGTKPPEGAIVLFDGTNTDEWEKGTLEGGLFKNSDPYTKRAFGSYTLHLEFRTPYKPFARGQARGNSGVYHQWRYETQVLDSFALEGANNETGGVYQISPSIVNMCFPPLAWQTYDIDFTTAKFDAEGKPAAHARITVRLNGVLVQDDLELPKTTGGAKLPISPEPGPIYIQSHGNPVYFRNMWIVPRD